MRGATTEAHQSVFNCSIKAQFSSARSLLISFCAHLLSTQLFDFRVFNVKNTKKEQPFPPFSLIGKTAILSFSATSLDHI